MSLNRYFICLAMLSTSAFAASPLTLQSLRPELSSYSEYFASKGNVRSMLVNIDTRNPGALTPHTSQTMNITFNGDGKSLEVRHKEGDNLNFYSLKVNSQDRNITTVLSVLSEGGSRTDAEIYSFNESGCSNDVSSRSSQESQDWEMDTTSAKIVCDGKGYPIKWLQNYDKPSPDLNRSWTWSADHTSVVFKNRELSKKLFFNAKGEVTTLILNSGGELSESKYQYMYDSKGNWIKRTMSSRAKSASDPKSTWAPAGTETVTRTISYGNSVPQAASPEVPLLGTSARLEQTPICKEWACLNIEENTRLYVEDLGFNAFHQDFHTLPGTGVTSSSLYDNGMLYSVDFGYAHTWLNGGDTQLTIDFLKVLTGKTVTKAQIDQCFVSSQKTKSQSDLLRTKTKRGLPIVARCYASNNAWTLSAFIPME